MSIYLLKKGIDSAEKGPSNVFRFMVGSACGCCRVHVKAMAVATRSVASTFLLISVLVYGFGIVFRTQLGTAMPEYFSDIWISMRTQNGTYDPAGSGRVGRIGRCQQTLNGSFSVVLKPILRVLEKNYMLASTHCSGFSRSTRFAHLCTAPNS